jgi:putative hydrolases of HD superfamily
MERMEKLYRFFQACAKLKSTYRYSTVPELKNKDSSADHSWRSALMAFMLAEELKLELDVCHAMKLLIVHDLPEAQNGDYDAHLVFAGKVTKEQKLQEEKEALYSITDSLPSDTAEEIRSLWKEFELSRTPEARFAQAIDKLEGMMTIVDAHAIKEPELSGSYGNKCSQECQQIIPVVRHMKTDLKKVFSEKGFMWKKEYDI